MLKNIAMLRRLLLLIISFVTMNAFAQMPSKISVSQEGNWVIVAPENDVWTKVRNGRKEAWFEPLDSHRSYWKKTLNGIRRKYITDEELSELRKKKILLDLSLRVDDKGHVFFVRMMAGKGILDVFSKRRLTNMYKEFLGLTVPLPVELNSSQYVNIRVSYI